MASWLKQSTAVDISFGPFVDSTDGFTPETALSLTQAECRLKKNGAAWAQKAQVTTAAHEEEGWYEMNLDTTDTNTLGILTVAVYVTGALPVWKEYMVLPANIYDSLVSGSDLIDVSVTQWLGSAVAAVTVAGVPEVDVTHWIGTAAATPTTAGVPEVDITFVNGVAISTTTAQIGVNVVQISTDAVAADNAEAFFDGTGYAGTGNTIPTVTTTTTATNVTTVNGIAAGAITAAAIATGAIDADALATDAVTEIWAVAMSDLAAVPAATDSVLSAINWMFELHRNRRTQTSTTETVYKDDGTTALSTSTKSDDGTTFIRGEYA